MAGTNERELDAARHLQTALHDLAPVFGTGQFTLDELVKEDEEAICRTVKLSDLYGRYDGCGPFLGTGSAVGSFLYHEVIKSRAKEWKKKSPLQFIGLATFVWQSFGKHAYHLMHCQKSHVVPEFDKIKHWLDVYCAVVEKAGGSAVLVSPSLFENLGRLIATRFNGQSVAEYVRLPPGDAVYFFKTIAMDYLRRN